jgi:hypothetical protein
LESTEPKLNSVLQPILKPKTKIILKTHLTSIVDGNGDILGIDDTDSDSSDDSPNLKKPPVPKWAESPNLRQQIEQQQNVDPDSIFSDLISPDLKGILY